MEQKIYNKDKWGKFSNPWNGFEFICTHIEGILISTKGHNKYGVQILEFILLIQETVHDEFKCSRLHTSTF